MKSPFFLAWVFVVETYLTVVSRLASGSWPFFLSLPSAGVHAVQLLSFSVLFFLLLCFNMQALRDTICDESRRVGSSPEVSRLLTVDKVIHHCFDLPMIPPLTAFSQSQMPQGESEGPLGAIEETLTADRKRPSSCSLKCFLSACASLDFF